MVRMFGFSIVPFSLEVVMGSRSSLDSLIEAADLLRMLEQLVDGLSRRPGKQEEAAWGGIGITLGQCRKNILHACQRLYEEANASSSEEIQRIPAQRSRSSLANRVQKAPTSGGTVRELRESPFGEKPQVSRHEENTATESLERTAES